MKQEKEEDDIFCCVWNQAEEIGWMSKKKLNVIAAAAAAYFEAEINDSGAQAEPAESDGPASKGAIHQCLGQQFPNLRPHQERISAYVYVVYIHYDKMYGRPSSS